MFEVAGQAGRDFVMLEQLAGVAGVFSQDQMNFA